MASLKDTIQSINNRYAAVLMRPGAPGAADFFTQDADLLPPGPDNLKGREAIQAFWAAVCDKGGEVRLTTADAVAIGDDAVRERYVKHALDSLEMALKAGYRDFKNLRTHADFGSLRQRPEFEKLLQQFEK